MRGESIVFLRKAFRMMSLSSATIKLMCGDQPDIEVASYVLWRFGDFEFEGTMRFIRFVQHFDKSISGSFLKEIERIY